MQDRPTASELLEVLAEFMRDRSANARDRWERFQFQVAANSINILKREFEMEDDFCARSGAGSTRCWRPNPYPKGRKRSPGG